MYSATSYMDQLLRDGGDIYSMDEKIPAHSLKDTNTKTNISFFRSFKLTN
jgi:hypothetical protein